MLANLEKTSISKWALTASIFAIPISGFFSIRLFIATLAISFFSKKNYSLLLTRSADVLIFFAILLIGLIYSDDTSTGWRTIETSFSLLAIPLIFANYPDISRRELNHYTNAFIAGALLASGICIVSAVISYTQTHDIAVFFSDQLTAVINSHPTYLAYYVIFCIAYILYTVYYDETQKNHWASAVLIIFLFVVLILTAGRTAFISLLLIISFFILRFVLEDKKKSKVLVLAIVIFMLLAMFVIHSLDEKNTLLPMGDYWERSMLWKSAIEANSNWLLGVGTGDYKTVLNEYYVSHNLADFAKDSYNSHNQFIQVYFSNGLIGLLALIFMLIRPMVKASRSQNSLVVLVFFPFMIYGMTEVFLGRFQGVVFFTLIHELFMANMDSVKTSFAPKRDEYQ